MSGVVRNVSRPGRLQWLNGRRDASGAWDAYGALDGQPLLALTGDQPWSTVSIWLSDLARELEVDIEHARDLAHARARAITIDLARSK